MYVGGLGGCEGCCVLGKKERGGGAETVKEREAEGAPGGKGKRRTKKKPLPPIFHHGRENSRAGGEGQDRGCAVQGS